MVISSSANGSWVRPAQAIIYLDSGEIRHFPPRNRGRLPRALTFHEQTDWGTPLTKNNNGLDHNKDDVELDAIGCRTDHSISYFMSVDLNNEDIEEPPNEYRVFEDGYYRHNMLIEIFLNQESTSMSTPTEQYYAKVLRHKRCSDDHLVVQSNHPSTPSTTSASGSLDDCTSPLLQTNYDRQLSISELVDLYTQKMVANLGESKENIDK